MSPGPEALKLRRQLVRTNAAPTNLTGELRLKVNGAGTSKGEAGQTGPGFWAGVPSFLAVARLPPIASPRVQIGRNAELRTQRSFVVAGSQVTKPTRQ